MGIKTSKEASNVVAIDRPETEGWFNVDTIDNNGKSVRIGGIPLSMTDAKGNDQDDIIALINALRNDPQMSLRLKFTFNDSKAEKASASFG